MNGRAAPDMFPLIEHVFSYFSDYFSLFSSFTKRKNSLQLAFRYALFLSFLFFFFFFSFKIRLSYLVTLFSLDTSPCKEGTRSNDVLQRNSFLFFFFFFAFSSLQTRGCDSFQTFALPRPTFHDNILQPIEINFDAGPPFAVPPQF